MQTYTNHDIFNSCESRRFLPWYGAGGDEKQRSQSDALSSQEISQTRALLMKGQWRALQAAPQYCARINLATSEISQPTLRLLCLLQEANNIVKDMRRTAKDIAFHSFNYGKKKPEMWNWYGMVFLNWGDASHKNRSNFHSTGGVVTGISTPRILEGYETQVSLLNWKSWKLKRVAAGSNGSEAQAIAEAEDCGWQARLLWAMSYGTELKRSNADELTSMCLSFLIMDSGGCYDSLTITEIPGMSMSSAVDIWSASQGLREGSNSHPASSSMGSRGYQPWRFSHKEHRPNVENYDDVSSQKMWDFEI